MDGESIERRCHGTSPIFDNNDIELDECDTMQPLSTRLSEAIERASPHRTDNVDDNIHRVKHTSTATSTYIHIVDDWYLRLIIFQNITSFLYRAMCSTSQRGRQKWTSTLDRLRKNRYPPHATPPLNGTRIAHDGDQFTHDSDQCMHDSNYNAGRGHRIGQIKEARCRSRYQRLIQAAVLLNAVTTTAATKFTLFQNENLTQGVIEQPLTSSPTTSIPTPLPTALSSNSPSLLHTLIPTASPTDIPTDPPTPSPTNIPTSPPTNSPSGSPTTQPTDIPTTTPTMTHVPTSTPTIAPTSTPSTFPSPSPSSDPTAHPTSSPTRTPTNHPTGHPTYNEPEIISQRFLQTYLGANLVELDPDQQRYFQNTIVSYTQHFAPNSEQDYVETDCIFEDQVYSRGRRRLTEVSEVRLLSVKNFVEVDFTVIYTSARVNVTEANYPDLFKNFMNSEQGKSRLRINLQSVGVAIDSVEDVRIKVENPPTSPPNPQPTTAPTNPPTIRTALPTALPSPPPTITPLTPSPTLTPNVTTIPSNLSPTPSTSPGPPVPLIASISSAAFATLLAGFIFCYIRPQKKKKRKTVTATRNVKNLRVDVGGGHGNDVESAIQMENFSNGSKSLEGYQSDDAPVPESLLSNDSLLSFGHSMSSDSILERDETNLLADEFDQYKNPDLEKMRSNVEGSVVNSDGMMSQALTRALMMDDEDSITSDNELRWGGDGDAMEIEASVLCETNDWLKRKEGASLEERRSFMQDSLNRMVASVRHNIIASEKAARAIHGCAAMLGLQLAENIPENSLIVTGMRKTVQKEDLVEAFKAFGEIDDAAVAPGSRGFGLVRYKLAKSVQRAIERFKKEEIVVQDVAVMVRILSSTGEILLPPPQQQQPPPRPPASAGNTGGSAMAAHNHHPFDDSLNYTNISLGDKQKYKFKAGSDGGYSSTSRRSKPASEDGRRRKKKGHSRGTSKDSAGNRQKGRHRKAQSESFLR